MSVDYVAQARRRAWLFRDAREAAALVIVAYLLGWGSASVRLEIDPDGQGGELVVGGLSPGSLSERLLVSEAYRGEKMLLRFEAPLEPGTSLYVDWTTSHLISERLAERQGQSGQGDGRAEMSWAHSTVEELRLTEQVATVQDALAALVLDHDVNQTEMSEFFRSSGLQLLADEQMQELGLR